jgi:uncharacterized protein (DUF433 family)
MDGTPISHIEIIDGHAVIRGRRLKAKLVASMYVKGGATIEEIMDQYDITRAEVHAALAYYYDHQDAIEESFREAEAYAREHGISAGERLAQIHARKQGKR